MKSDSKLYINLKFCEEKSHKYIRNVLIYEANQSMSAYNIVLKMSTYVKDTASGVQVDDFEQVFF